MATSLFDRYNLVQGHEFTNYFGQMFLTIVCPRIITPNATCLALAACVGHIRKLGHGAVAEWLKAAVC
jgi:hypothetical protein